MTQLNLLGAGVTLAIYVLSSLVFVARLLGRRHNALGLTEPLPERAKPFFGRPYRVIALHGFAEALLGRVEAPRSGASRRTRPSAAAISSATAPTCWKTRVGARR